MSSQQEKDQKKREEMLAGYVRRLSEGENLETVRKEFVRNFQDVDAGEIAKAEQTLITSGVPVSDVQRLCDVHSALFHGATRQEQIANAEKAVQDSLGFGKPAPLKRQDGGDLLYKKLTETPGHPLSVFSQENQAITGQLKKMREALASGENVRPELEKTRQVAVHYAKKGDLLYPILKTKYGFSGPADVMWGVDDEIRDEMKVLAGALHAHSEQQNEETWRNRIDAVLVRAEEMVYKEENILFPLCAKNFSEEDWKQIARDMQGYELCLIPPVPKWDAAFGKSEAEKHREDAGEPSASEKETGEEGEVSFRTGHMTPAQIEAVLNTIPMELTFVDDQNINRFFNDNGEPKLFKRPLAALGREVFTCHPPKVEPMVRMIIQEFREGKRDSVEVWNSRGGEPVLIRYMAVRDQDGKYVGTLECVQRMGFAQEHFEK